jgi:hypothetical protein
MEIIRDCEMSLTYTFASIHPSLDFESSFLRKGTVFLTESHPLRKELNVTAEEFCGGVEHIETLMRSAEESNIHRRAGTIVFRHPRIPQSSVMRYEATCVSLPDNLTCCITKIRELSRSEDQDLEAFLGLLECRVRLGMLPWRRVVRKDKEYTALRGVHVGTMTESLRARLVGMGVILNLNVSWTEADGSHSHRSVLFPYPVLQTDVFQRHPAEVYSVLQLHPYPKVVDRTAPESCRVDATLLPWLNSLRHAEHAYFPTDDDARVIKVRNMAVCWFLPA